MAILLSVNIGTPQNVGDKPELTGIFKQSQSRSVMIGTEGLVGDAIVDRNNHGGVDQAVYLYFDSDYQWWREQLDIPLTPGHFGEDLTIGGLEGTAIAVGDRFSIGDVVLEATSHRTPCAKFAARMGDSKFVKRFHQAGRPGAYCRVLVPGAVEAGQQVDYQAFAGPRIRMPELMALDGVRRIDPAFMQRALQTPVHHLMRADFEQRLRETS